MSRDWLSFRLPRLDGPFTDDHAARAMTDVVPALVRHLRAADSAGRWHFRRTDEGTSGELQISFLATPVVLGELEYRLRVHADRQGWPAVVVPPPARPGPGDPGTEPELGDHLSAISSDFAMELLGLGFDPADQFRAAAFNLRFICGFLPEKQQLPFLFHGWQHWSRALTPAHRVELGERAAVESVHILRISAPDELRGHWREPWNRYFDAVTASVSTHAAAPNSALAYVLFEHAHLTHNRLGVAPSAEAAAARALRTALAGRHDSQPVTPPPARLTAANAAA